MRALTARSGTLDIVEVPTPEPGRGQVRIKMEAATVNPVDLATRDGHLAAFYGPRERVGLGWDVAGTIDEMGPGVTGFELGEMVIGVSDILGLPSKTHADLVVLDAAAVARAPRGVTPVEAATIPLNGLTASQAIDLLGLHEGQSVLVTGAAGGVGGFAVELAAARGLRVVALASPADEELVRRLGAEWFVPRGADPGPAVRDLVPGGVDGAIDAAIVGAAALEAVRGGGAFAAVVGGTAPTPLRGTRVANVWIRADGTRLAELAALAETGRLNLRVAGTHPLGEAATAYGRVADGGVRGRVVLIP
ncbi:NADP-dependent oxidoreductase [Microtetraspora malaysiensis]|uniref:NADP-dependent oxidoreductase n=1 Tax=Microtetraspora malaysiensis TaxID=161358 RepID=UPI003D916A60